MKFWPLGRRVSVNFGRAGRHNRNSRRHWHRSTITFLCALWPGASGFAGPARARRGPACSLQWLAVPSDPADRWSLPQKTRTSVHPNYERWLNSTSGPYLVSPVRFLTGFGRENRTNFVKNRSQNARTFGPGSFGSFLPLLAGMPVPKPFQNRPGRPRYGLCVRLTRPEQYNLS